MPISVGQVVSVFANGSVRAISATTYRMCALLIWQNFRAKPFDRATRSPSKSASSMLFWACLTKAAWERRRHVFVPLGGGTLKGVGKPGEFVWSRIFAENGQLHADMGQGTAVELPAEETERRWQAISPEWPIMHGVLHGVSRDQMMARHKANHLQVAYAPSAAEADQALAVKAAMLANMGIRVHLCGFQRPKPTAAP